MFGKEVIVALMLGALLPAAVQGTDYSGRGPDEDARVPDLTVTNLRLTPACTLTVTIANRGSGSVPPRAYNPTRGAMVQMYRGSKPWGGIRLVAVDPDRKLRRPGSAVTYRWFPDAASLKLGPGEHSMRAVVDHNNAVQESNETNNSRIERLRCPAVERHSIAEHVRQSGGAPGRGQPDLGIYGNLRIGKNRRPVKWGEAVTLTPEDAILISDGKPAFDIYYSFRELKDVPAPGPFRNRVFFNGKLVSQKMNLSAEPGKIRTVHTQAYLGPEKGRLSVSIDADNEVSESRENNNGPFTVNLQFSGFGKPKSAPSRRN